MKPDPNTLLTKAEAKARLGLKNDTSLSRLIRRGKLRVVKYGQTSPLRFRQMDVDACIEGCTVTGADVSPGGTAQPGESRAGLGSENFRRDAGSTLPGKEPTP